MDLSVIQCIWEIILFYVPIYSFYVSLHWIIVCHCLPENDNELFAIDNKIFVFLSLQIGDEDEGQEQRVPNCFDYFMHILCIFWKILFACVPPTEYWNGWACFIVSISVIGFLTAIIGDLASHFGCTVGLRDSVTAVVFVALGTSLPGQWLH